MKNTILKHGAAKPANNIMKRGEVIYSFSIENTNTINLSCGNSKIGRMMNWSTLPGNSEHPLIAKGRQITNVEGTCSHNCNGCFKNCYARRSILQHHNRVTKAWATNTLMIRFKLDECFRQIDTKIRELNNKFYASGKPEDIKFKFFRINVSGEIQSLQELEHWNDLAASHPHVRFGIYSKNSEVLLAFFTKHHQTAPNFTINVSQWNHVMDDTIQKLRAMGAQFNIFTYDESNRAACKLSEQDKAALKATPHCPAVLQSGSHFIKPDGKPLLCSECRRCYIKTCKETAVYSH